MGVGLELEAEINAKAKLFNFKGIVLGLSGNNNDTLCAMATCFQNQRRLMFHDHLAGI